MDSEKMDYYKGVNGLKEYVLLQRIQWIQRIWTINLNSFPIREYFKQSPFECSSYRADCMTKVYFSLD